MKKTIETAQELAENYNTNIAQETLGDIATGGYHFRENFLEEFLDVELHQVNGHATKVELQITAGGPSTVLTIYNNGAGDITTWWGSGESTIYFEGLEEFFEWLIEILEGW